MSNPADDVRPTSIDEAHAFVDYATAAAAKARYDLVTAQLRLEDARKALDKLRRTKSAK